MFFILFALHKIEKILTHIFFANARNFVWVWKKRTCGFGSQRRETEPTRLLRLARIGQLSLPA